MIASNTRELVKLARALIEPLRDGNQMPSDREAILNELASVLDMIGDGLDVAFTESEIDKDGTQQREGFSADRQRRIQE